MPSFNVVVAFGQVQMETQRVSEELQDLVQNPDPQHLSVPETIMAEPIQSIPQTI